MKKTVCIMLTLCMLLLTACMQEMPKNKAERTSTPEPSAPAAKPQEVTLATPAPRHLPIEGSMEFLFSSGMGAWGTTLVLEADGTFTGEYSDTNAGESGEGHLATIYLCSFSGEFGEFEKINDYTYAMQLTEIHLEKEAGQEWIEDEVKYVTSGPVGLEGGTEFVLYTPDAPLEMLPESFVNWFPGGGENLGTEEGTLGCYGIYNETNEQGFYGDFI